MSRRSALMAATLWCLGGGAIAAPVRRRIVSVGGAITETLYALGAQADIVGVDTTSLYPAPARSLPSVGYARSLSAEGILSLAPTRVITDDDAGPPAVLRQLEAAGVPLSTLKAQHRFEGVVARTMQLGELVALPVPARALVQQLQAQWQAVRSKVQARLPQPSLRVLFMLSHAMNAVRVAGQGTAADAMIGYAGAVNALTGVAGYKPLTPEAAIGAAPDVILMTEQGLQAAGGVAGVLGMPGLAQTPAGRAQRIVAMDAVWMLGFGPRLPQAVLALSDTLQA